MCVGLMQLIFLDSDFEAETSYLNLTCAQYNKVFTHNLDRLKWAWSQNGNAVTIHTEDKPIMDYIATSYGNDYDSKLHA